MSGSGMVAESNPRPSKKASGVRIGLRSSPTLQCRENQLLFPFYRNSFRSGSAFGILGGLPTSEVAISSTTLLENLVSISGMDIGHEYERTMVTEMFSSFHRKSGFDTNIYNLFLPRTFVNPYGAGLLDAAAIKSYVTSYTSVPDVSLVAQGERLINLTNPLRPPVNLAIGLSEFLREGLPSQLGHALLSSAPNKRSLIRALGRDYLSYMFGFSPIIRDISNLVKTLQGSYKIVSQWERNDGRLVRRRRAWDGPTTKTTYNKTLSGTGYSLSGLIPTSASNYAAKGFNQSTTGGSWAGSIESNTQEDIKYSFSAGFEYHLENLIPDFPEPIRKLLFGSSSNEAIVEALLIERQFGLDPASINSPETYWNLLPFSWLIDWFVNVGDFFSAVNAFQLNGLKLGYGYMSVHQTRRFSADWRFTYNGSVYESTSLIIGKHDRRIRATPFGFGMSYSGLNPVQSSLIAALATSRGR